MPMVSIKIWKSNFIFYDIMRRIHEMGADVLEELSDLTHKFVNVCCPWKWWYIGHCAFSKVIASTVGDSDNISEEYMQILQNRFHQFQSRFQDVEIFCTECQLFSNVFSIDFKYFPRRYQLELLKLQSEDLLRYKYKSKSGLVDF